MTKFLLITLLSSALFACAQPNEEHYLFFLHNRFLEEHSTEEAHPEYGIVEYEEILSAFEQKGLNVISEQRQGNVNARDYAAQVVTQIDYLISEGILAQNITVVGTSKGGYIAQYVSTLAQNPDLNFVFIACYRESDLAQIPDIQFCGNILNIYEKSDPFGQSAQSRVEQSNCTIHHFKEIELNTQLKHGFLFKAMDEWIQPTVDWAYGNY